jgi:repressor LexA
LDFIEDFITREKMPPTRAEIAKHFGWKSWNAAEQVVKRLAQLRRIELVPLVSRGIKLSDEWRLG